MKKESQSLLFLIFYLLLNVPLFSQNTTPGQGSKYPLNTKIDTTFYKTFKKDLSYKNFNEARTLEYRETLRSLATSNDPLAMHLYAQTYDWYVYGAGEEKDAVIALKYYRKAAKKKLALANQFLYYGFKYGFMEIERDEKKAKKYLEKAIKFGDAELQRKCYEQMAGLYYPYQGEKEPLKAISYLEKSMEEGADNHRQHDFLAHIYEEQKQLEKAIFHRLASPNINGKVIAAKWLVQGKLIEKDIPRALKILIEATDEMQRKFPDGKFQGAENPHFYLNHLHYCDKLLTKEQLGKYLLDSYICP